MAIAAVEKSAAKVLTTFNCRTYPCSRAQAFCRRMVTYIVSVVLATIACIHSASAYADGFTIEDPKIVLRDKVYLLSAQLNFDFSDVVLEAINNGVSITLVLDIELMRPRNYIWDDELASLEQRYQLQYHALSEQFVVRNINAGAQYTFFSLQSALEKIGVVQDLPIIDEQLLTDKKENNYFARIRTRIEYENLPVPLRINAWISSSWWLGSDWYKLDL